MKQEQGGDDIEGADDYGGVPEGESHPQRLLRLHYPVTFLHLFLKTRNRCLTPSPKSIY